MDDFEKKITELKDNIEKAKNMKIRAEARLEQLNIQKSEIILELDKLSIKPENLNDEINKLEKEIEELINETEKLIPKELLINSN